MLYLYTHTLYAFILRIYYIILYRIQFTIRYLSPGDRVWCTPTPIKVLCVNMCVRVLRTSYAHGTYVRVYVWVSCFLWFTVCALCLCFRLAVAESCVLLFSHHRTLTHAQHYWMFELEWCLKWSGVEWIIIRKNKKINKKLMRNKWHA